jgi:uncharacterized protein (TIGR00251 family)
VRVRALPRGSKNGIQGVHDGRLQIKTTAPPADGKANKDLLRQLAKAFKVPPSQVELTSGKTQRNKTFKISEPRVVPDWLAELDSTP